jgi:predicted nucleotidyltransferase
MKTVLDLSREEWQPYIEQIRARPSPPGPSEAEIMERTRVLTLLRKAAAHLKEIFGAEEVILFGSYALEGASNGKSDLDIAVSGLSPHDFWAAWKLIEETVDDRPVDLIDMETASLSLKESIRKFGIEL